MLLLFNYGERSQIYQIVNLLSTKPYLTLLMKLFNMHKLWDLMEEIYTIIIIALLKELLRMLKEMDCKYMYGLLEMILLLLEKIMLINI